MRIILLGLAMLAFGGTLLFGHVSSLPLWVCWTVGPLCWYLGFAVTGTGVLLRAMKEFTAAEPETRKAPVVVAPKHKEPVMMHRLVRVNGGPAGVMHEIPAMGGFII
jgi:hypothetical protein